MATYTVNQAKHATLTAATVDTVTFPDADHSVEVYNRSAAGYIYFTTDNSAPTVAGDNTFVVGPGQALPIPDAAVESANVKLISATADAYSVTAF